MTRLIPTTKAGVDTPVTLINDPVFADAKVRPVAYQAVVTVAPGDTLR